MLFDKCTLKNSCFSAMVSNFVRFTPFFIYGIGYSILDNSVPNNFTLNDIETTRHGNMKLEKYGIDRTRHRDNRVLEKR